MKKLTSLWLTLVVALTSLAGCAADASSVGIIGGSDGPTQILLTNEGNSGASQNDAKAPPQQENGEGTGNQENAPPSGDLELGPAVTGKEKILQDTVIEEEGCYTSKEEVALYIMKYGALPGNYITKKEAKELGWEGGSLDSYAPGKSIGGDHFGNYEGSLPESEGRSYTECDIDPDSNGRGAKRIIFSNDGLIFYTADHYETFTLLTGD